MIEDRVSKFELRGTVNLHLHGTVGVNDGLHVHRDCVDWHYSVCTYHKTLDNEAHNKDEEVTT